MQFGLVKYTVCGVGHTREANLTKKSLYYSEQRGVIHSDFTGLYRVHWNAAHITWPQPCKNTKALLRLPELFKS